MEDEVKIEMVDRYLRNEMDDDERASFESMLNTDEELTLLVDSQRRLIDGLVEFEARRQFFDMLHDIKNDPPADKPMIDYAPMAIEKSTSSSAGKELRIRNLRRRLAYAAGVAILVTSLLFIFYQNRSPGDLANDYFVFHEDLITDYLEASGIATDVNAELYPIIQEGIKAYNQGEYESAYAKITEFISSAADQNYLVVLSHFYLAQLAYYRGENDKARELLESLNQEDDLPFSSEVKWYLSLVYLKDGNIGRTRTMLDILKSDAIFGTKANELMEAIEDAQ
ncbi:MAG: hypothetical protein HKN87_24435 [Saprospiraceae bacterium]|nr:hypothetical protein [Saprospiraceae bacterium]